MASTPNPNTTTTTTTRPFTATNATTKSTTTTTPPRPQSPFQIHHQHIYPVIRPQSQNPNSILPTNHLHHHQQQPGVLYPVASSGRGFIPRHIRSQPDQTVTTNQGSYHPRGVAVAYRPHTATTTGGSPSSRSHPSPQPLGDPHNVQQQMMSRQHPTHSQHQNYVGLGLAVGSAAAPIKGIPVTSQLKVAPSPSLISDCNGYKNLRERSRDDNLAVIRDRKVRISDGASLYVLCRSWLRNGFPEESQVQYGDSIKPLPRPLLPKMEGEDEVENEMKDDEPVDHLSAEDLLKQHIKHAKKVRARLREGRLKRIARYKSRLALLLPPQVEQFRNDTAAEN